MSFDKARVRAHSRRPITEEEVPYLESLGDELGRLRKQAGFTYSLLGDQAEISAAQLRNIVHGVRRTRASTLLRICVVLAEWLDETPEEIRARLVELAGPALAPEAKPEHQDRIDRRRADAPGNAQESRSASGLSGTSEPSGARCGTRRDAGGGTG